MQGASVAAGRERRFLLRGGLCEHSGDALGHTLSKGDEGFLPSGGSPRPAPEKRIFLCAFLCFSP